MSNVTIKKLVGNNCKYCAILGNYLSEIDLESEGATLEEINVSDQPEVAEQYGIMNVPVLVFERNGIEISRSVGLVPVEQIVDSIQHAKEAK